MKKQNIHFPDVRDGGIFSVGGMDFIKFPSVDDKTPVVMKDIAFESRFGNSNDFKSSDILKKLETDVLPRIIEAVGRETLCTVKTDLTALDGLTPYEPLESLISLPTLDFYRENVRIFDQYIPQDWWWLATPESAPPHSQPWWTLCVAPSGCVNNFYFDYCYGVRPFLIFQSSIFESSEE